ncbi:hypothetical protein C8Q75DRAFT_807618 [Abortiporus biennis]|nr:hypothetical protein C8Q75DRAFT_807618 [Abortiporus biennis]
MPEPNPAAAHQTKFRVVPKKSYSERMSETRAEIRRIMKEALRDITQDENASMRWPSYWKDIVVKYRVAIVGWPYNEVPFRNLSDVSNLQKLELLLRGWQEKTIYFRHITDAEFAMMDAERASQIDTGI